MDIDPLAQNPNAAAERQGEDIERAAQKLEAYFLRRVLAEVRAGGGEGMLSGGFAGETFQEMLHEKLADQMAEAGGLGISETFTAQMQGTQTVSMPGRITAYRRGGASLSVLPVAGRQSSPFGDRVDPMTGAHSRHTGLDIAAPEGTPVRAAAEGHVVRAGDAGGYGNMVVVSHPGGLETRYAHLSEIGVEVGEHLPAGATVGAVGSTGRSTGPHLHFEVRRDGDAVDPRSELPMPIEQKNHEPTPGPLNGPGIRSKR